MPEKKPGAGRLLGCLLYEGLVIFAILLIGFWLPQALLAGVGLGFTPRLLWLHILALLMLYFCWFWLHGGQTLPMKTWKIRLVSANGLGLRPFQAILRYLAAWPCILLGGIGLLWCLLDKDGQYLHDRIAGTRIIFSP